MPLVVSDVATHWDAVLCVVAQKNVHPGCHTALLAAHERVVAALLLCVTFCQPWAFRPAALLFVCSYVRLFICSFVVCLFVSSLVRLFVCAFVR